MTLIRMKSLKDKLACEITQEEVKEKEKKAKRANKPEVVKPKSKKKSKK